MTPTRWILLALLFRLIAAGTQISTGHPDEWFQTVEFGNYLAFGFLGQTNEFLLHMRNLTWPTLLAAPLKLSHWIAPENLFLRLYAVKILTGLLDLLMIWGFSKLLETETSWPRRWKTATWALFILPWFTIADSVRPSQEHLSAIACWFTLGLLALIDTSNLKKNLLLAGTGICIILTGAFRYPSGLLGLGILVALLLRRSIKNKGTPLLKTRWIFLGLILGLGLGGLADWIFYGRPWESLWMYLQYNVFTGISRRDFGSQPALATYLTYFKGYLGGIFIPIGLACTALIPIGLFQGISRLQPWAFATSFYLIGHFFISHKEPRFMAPIFFLTLWAFLQGAWIIQQFLSDSLKRICFAVLCIVAVLNTALLARALWGETWKAGSNYLELGSLLKQNPACAIITVRRPVSTLLPWNQAGHVPEPALAYFPAPAHQPSSQNMASLPLIWIERQPTCFAGSFVLFQPQQPEYFFEQIAGCKILKAGPLKFFSQSNQVNWIERKWVTAPWYSCPSSILLFFKQQETRRILVKSLFPMIRLPEFGVSAEEFIYTAQKGIDPSQIATHDATLGDF